MKRTRLLSHGRRYAVAVAAAALVGSALAGCASGDAATSRKPYAPGDGLFAVSGDVRALNVLVVAADGADEGVVVMTLANTGRSDDRLTGIESSAGSVQLSGPTSLTAGSAVQFSNDSETTATITGLSREPGQAIALTLHFANAEPIRLRTVVRPATGDFEGITPSAPPTPSPTETPSPSETETPAA